MLTDGRRTTDDGRDVPSPMEEEAQKNLEEEKSEEKKTEV
jgi:hypothetical protein